MFNDYSWDEKSNHLQNWKVGKYIQVTKREKGMKNNSLKQAN